MSAASQLPYLMTVAEFLDWETPDGFDRWELIDGTPEAMAPASDRHGAIHGEVARLIGNHLSRDSWLCQRNDRTLAVQISDCPAMTHRVLRRQSECPGELLISQHYT